MVVENSFFSQRACQSIWGRYPTRGEIAIGGLGLTYQFGCNIVFHISHFAVCINLCYTNDKYENQNVPNKSAELDNKLYTIGLLLTSHLGCTIVLHMSHFGICIFVDL